MRIWTECKTICTHLLLPNLTLTNQIHVLVDEDASLGGLDTCARPLAKINLQKYPSHRPLSSPARWWRWCKPFTANRCNERPWGAGKDHILLIWNVFKVFELAIVRERVPVGEKGENRVFWR
jgi:hypothetical protein